MSYKFKVCTRCDIRKKISSFSSQIVKGKRYYKPYCSGCKSADYRKRKPEVIKKNVKDYKKRYRDNQLKLKAGLLAHINQTGCKECGYTDVRAISFHHRDPKEKSFKISDGFTHNMSFDALKKEAEKCDALCMNCHVILHRTSL